MTPDDGARTRSVRAAASVTEPTIAVAGEADRASVLATLEFAFAADPVMRWFWPDPGVYRAAFPRFVEAMAGRSFEHGSAHVLADARAVALWLPPSVNGDDDAITMVIIETVEATLFEDLSAFADLVREHHPESAHWYLPITGVDPFLQGTGLGTSLLRHALELCDRDGVPAYLEASTPRSRALYQRAGFEETGVIQVGSSPTIWPMLRPPTGRS